MRRRNLWIIGVSTAIVTAVSLNAAFGTRHWRYYAGYRHHPHHSYYDDCDGYNQRDSANTRPHQRADTTTAQY